jgi:hypothetical protein
LFIDDTTLDWENFLPALMLSYNTSYHSTIATTPFELLFGEKPRMPSFPNPEIQRTYYGESSSAERYQLLQKIQFLAKNIASDQGDKIKGNFDKSALAHNFEINDLVWYEDFVPLGKNAKLMPKWQGPSKITEINDTNARILLANGKTKILNVMRINKCFKHSDNSDTQNKTVSGSDELNFNSKSEFTGPVTRAMKKLLEQQNATNMAVSVLCDLSKKHCSMCEWEQECSDNPLLFDPLFARQYIKDRQSWLINKQSMCAKCKLQLGERLLDNQAANTSSSIHQQCHDFSKSDKLPKSDDKNFIENFPFQELNSKELIKKQNELREASNLIKTEEKARAFNQNLINDSDIKSKGDIFLINEALREPLMHIANKLLGRQHLNFKQLTPPEQELWSLFEKSDIFEFLTGQKDTVPQFENYLTFAATPSMNINIQRIAQNLHPIFPTQPQGAIQKALSAPTQVTHFLHERKEKIDYKAIHLGQQIKHNLQQVAQEAKGKCKAMRKSVRKSAKAAITKLAPGAFSPKHQPPASAPSSPHTTSSSSWNFWPSK